MLDSTSQARITQTVEQSAADRARVRGLVAAHQWRKAEPDMARLKAFTTRMASTRSAPGAEAIVGDTVDFQGVTFLTDGSAIRRAVGYVEVNDARSSEVGSGFLISPRLFLTCCHVIKDQNAAHAAQVTFDREFDHFHRPSATSTYLLDPDIFALFSGEDDLDYAVIAIGQRNSGTADLKDLHYCALSDTPDRHALGMNVNIIQHPRGLPKMIAIRNNILTYRTSRTLLCETDTEQGSSGSPVFNDDWDLIALHHWGQPFLENKDDQGRPIPNNVNEGVRISAIYEDLQKRASQLSSNHRELLTQALSLANIPAVSSPGEKNLSPPRPGPEALPQIQGGALSDNDEFRVTIPIEITVRVGAPPQVPAPALVRAAAPTLKRGPEALQVDEDYTNRGGYEPTFIKGQHLDLPTLSGALAKQVAPLRATEPHAAEGELKYEHFSIKMSRTKRVAIYTATNIDGPTYLSVDRKTGEVSDGEGERWFKDPRISETFYLDQSFYSDWSTYFDRGHLTRRNDPTWGTKDQAERANADTFHFTNCSPQHFRFNESAKFWQGAERYVLENGLLTVESNRLSVFQGPIFDSKIDHWADDVQIPSSFFKVVVWLSKKGLKAVGIVVDQLALLDEKRVSLGAPKDLPSVNVSHWRIAISKIQDRTGLNFGERIQGADTIKDPKQPLVGEEAIVKIQRMEDILAGFQ